MYFGTFCDTPIGRLAIICTETALHAIDRLDKLPCHEEKIPIVAEVERQIKEYFSYHTVFFEKYLSVFVSVLHLQFSGLICLMYK